MQGTAKARYDALKVKREHFVQRGRDAASVTIPALLPPDGHTPASRLPEPYQGFGARCVTNLASRLLIALLPPGQSSFVLTVPPEVLQSAGVEKLEKDQERGMALSEQSISSEIERKQWRAPTFVALQYLVTTGNALEQMLPDNTIRVFRLDQYVVVRDPNGNLTELITEEFLYPVSLPEELRGMVSEDARSNEKIGLYTWAKKRPDGRWDIHQEVNDTRVPDSEGTWRVLPYNALRWKGLLGEDYGRGKVEEHLGDFRAIDGLSKAMVDGAAMASRNLQMVRPNAAGGLNLRRSIAKSDNGAVITGNPEDVAMLRFENVPGLQASQAELQARKQEVGAAFLLGGGTVRDAERVTAAEIRLMTQELEGTLGGTFSMLAQEMQSARLERLIIQMQSNGQLPDWPEGIIEPVVLTGLEALGRERDVERVATALQFLNGLPPEQLDYVNMPVLLGKAMNGLQLPGAVRTEDEANQIRQQRMMMQMAQQAAGPAANKVAEAAAGAMTGEQ